MPEKPQRHLNWIHSLFPVGHFIISLLFMAVGVSLIVLSCWQLWTALSADMSVAVRINVVLEGLAVITVALAALELGETIIEEQVQREAHMSAPTRVRRFISRFMVVLVVALSIETLVLVFKYSHEDAASLPYAAVVGLSAAALLIAWAVFIKLNRAAEELEPEAMREAKEEDKKMG